MSSTTVQRVPIRSFRVVLVAVLTTCAIAMGVVPAQASPADTATAPAVTVEEMASGLDVLNQVPDEALADDATLAAWLKSSAGADLRTQASAVAFPDTNETASGRDTRGLGDLAACAAAVGGIVLGVAVPAVKLLKIKKLISELGGVWEAAKLLVGAGTAAEKGEAAVTALAALVGELSGITGVVKACPNVFK